MMSGQIAGQKSSRATIPPLTSAAPCVDAADLAKCAATKKQPARPPHPLLGDQYRAIAPFIGIGLLVALIAVSRGVQGVWF